ncbi:MAG: ASKHA domain-containing protein [Acidobacteriota bacterium]|jgi:uncharacterized 2Fe-2S/4Fe-4S cluster protein (DUF4445 family)|nr:ASKHA domain-containing protein [Acidobacteriota bacterium]
MYVIEFEPVGRRGVCPEGETLLECARRLDVDIVNVCGGAGVCGRCKVQVVSGAVSPPDAGEKEALTDREVADGYRLACMARPLGNVKVHVPPESLTAPQRTQVEGLELAVKPDPSFQSMDLELTPPTIEAQHADETNLREALARAGLDDCRIDFAVLQRLSPRLRTEKWRVRAAVRPESRPGASDAEVVAVGAGTGLPTRWCGLAVDIGTTKVAAYLVDMQSGRTLGSKGLMNPQIAYGEDVVARIYAAGKSAESAAKLQTLLVDALNDAVGGLCDAAGVSPGDVADAVIVGNTAIHHLFLKLPVLQLGLAPYVPALRSAIDVKARDLGLGIAPGAYVHLLPNIAGYVGADHVAMILGTGLAEKDGVTLAIDIGTNTEMCLNRRGEMASVSCASGPAFEGAHIKHGMRAAPGAIEHVRLDGERLSVQTIGGLPPTGICGSGLLDVVAQLRKNDVVDSTGRMRQHPLVRLREDGMKEFVLAGRAGKDDITISQKDVRELQLAKSAIRLGVRVLAESAGVHETEIDEVVIAGAFGTFIDVESAITIGMLPDLPREKFSQVGNAAGTGARLALLSLPRRREAAAVAARIRYIELAAVPDFNLKLIEASAMKEGAY